MTPNAMTIIVSLASLGTTLLIMYFFIGVLKTRTANLGTCFICVLSTSLIMATAIQMPPIAGIEREHFQFFVAVTVSAVVYHAFLSTTIIKSVFLAASNFMFQISTLLCFSVAANMVQAQGLLS